MGNSPASVSTASTSITPVQSPGTLAFRPNGVRDTAGEAVLISVSTDRSICVWNPYVDRNFNNTVDERLRCHDLGICAVSAMANHQVATASADTTVKTWQLMLGGTKPEPRLTLRGHTGAVHSLCYISSKGWLASGGEDAKIRLWRAQAAATQGRQTHVTTVLWLTVFYGLTMVFCNWAPSGGQNHQ